MILTGPAGSDALVLQTRERGQHVDRRGYALAVELTRENDLTLGDVAGEVGDGMDAVIKRLFESGMTVEQVSEKSQYPIEYVKRFAK